MRAAAVFHPFFLLPTSPSPQHQSSTRRRRRHILRTDRTRRRRRRRRLITPLFLLLRHLYFDLGKVEVGRGAMEGAALKKIHAHLVFVWPRREGGGGGGGGGHPNPFFVPQLSPPRPLLPSASFPSSSDSGLRGETEIQLRASCPRKRRKGIRKRTCSV